MKKLFIISLTIALITAYSPSFAQIKETKHEITAGVGFINDNQTFYALADIFGTVVTLGFVVQPGNYNLVTPNVNYRYWFNDRVALGGTFGFDVTSVKIHKEVPQGETWDVNDFQIHQRYFFSMAVECEVHYMKRALVQIYGVYGLGITIRSIPTFTTIKTAIFPNAQVSPFGLRVGRNYGGFLEIGWGYKGLFNVGFSAKF